MASRVHWAGPYDEQTACGKVALLPDGTRLLETDTRADQLSCKTCERLHAKEIAK